MQAESSEHHSEEEEVTEEQQQLAEAHFQETNQLMSITGQAVDDLTPTNTPCVFITIGGKRTVDLLDSGSTSTFIDQSFALKANCPLLPTTHTQVQVAGGGTLSSHSVVPDCSFSIGKHQFSHHFRALSLPGHDVVLGCDWMSQYSPVAFHFKQQEFHMQATDGTAIILPTCSPTETAVDIEPEQLCKLLDKGATGFIIQLHSLQLTDKANQELNADITLLLEQYGDVFEEPTELPPSRSCDHRIPLVPDTNPPQMRPYRVPHKLKDELEKQIKHLLETKLIRPSHSPYASQVILVKKKDISWRLCIDFRKLNAQTVKNKFPVPVIEDLLDELHGAKIFSKLDLRSGYHQIRMHEDDIHKTAFKTYFGHFEYVVMPFGLSNAPATFQSLMNDTFSDHLRKFILVFFDDILVYGQTMEEHLQHLHIALSLLRQHQLAAKMSKCVFGVSHVEYLGHVISAEGVSTDLAKISAIADWETPQSVT
jgi:hypothetical protein